MSGPRVPTGAVTRATASVAAFAAGYGVYRAGTPLPLADVLRVQWGGSCQALPLPVGTREDVLWDVAFIAGYGVSLWVAAPLATSCSGSRRGRKVRLAQRSLVVAAVAADLAEDSLILLSLRDPVDQEDARALLALVTGAAAVKFLFFVPAVLSGAGLVLCTCVQALRARSGHRFRARP